METTHQNVIMDLSLEFSILLIRYEKDLSSSMKGNIVTQLLRCGTSIGAMIREAQGAESKKDFIHKMKIAYKESEETEYWLFLQQSTFPCDEIILLRNLLTRIKKVLGKILATCSKPTT